MRRIRRVTVGVVEIAGNTSSVAKGFGQLGLDARVVLLEEHPFDYERQPPGRAEGRLRATLAERRSGKTSPWNLAVEAAMRAYMSVKTAIWSDLVVLIGGQSFLAGWDLWLFRLFRTRVIVFYCGSDSRPPYLNGAVEVDDIEEIVRRTRHLARRVWRFERLATAVVVNPLSAQLHRREFFRVQDVGLPVPLAIDADRAGHEDDVGALRLLHAPSRPKLKGTSLIREAVRNLDAAGIVTEYQELVGVPHAEVLQALRDADLVLDQMYADTDLAGLAVEAAMLSVPSLVGCVEPDAVRRWVDESVDDRVFLTASDNVAHRLRELAVDRSALALVGARAKEHVVERCDPAAVARRLIELASGTSTLQRMNPATINYPWGCGLPAHRVRERVTEVVATAGWAALCVEHAPGLLESLRDIVDTDVRS